MVKVYAGLAQARARAWAWAWVAYQEHCPIGELLAAGEGAHLEYKSTLRDGADTNELIKVLETAVIKTVAAFATSARAAPC